MTPNELYGLTPIRVDNDISVLFGCYFDHLPEVGADYWQIAANRIECPRLEIRYYRDHHYDGRRIWRLASAWLDCVPFMILQNAGREGDDHAARFITDVEYYQRAASYIKSLLLPKFDAIPDVVAADADIPTLTAFYGDKLDVPVKEQTT